MSSRVRSKFVLSYCLSGAIVPAVLLSCVPVCGAAPAKSGVPSRTDAINAENLAAGLKDNDLKALVALETTYFQRTFEGDPPEKRVKRIELFLKGYGQTGTLAQRIADLKDYGAAKHMTVKPGLAPTKHNATQSVTQLELSILKKANPNADLSTRLTTLEKKVFGAAFANISIEQRIARLQKTIGIGDEDIAEVPQMQMRQFSGTIGPGGSFPQGIFPPGTFPQGAFPPSTMFNSPFMSPYGSGGGINGDPDINRHMTEMFDHLNQQLRQLHSLPPNAYGLPQIQQQPPDGSFEFSDGLPNIPRDGMLKAKPVLPPYLDPNSI